MFNLNRTVHGDDGHVEEHDACLTVREVGNYGIHDKRQIKERTLRA